MSLSALVGTYFGRRRQSISDGRFSTWSFYNLIDNRVVFNELMKKKAVVTNSEKSGRPGRLVIWTLQPSHSPARHFFQDFTIWFKTTTLLQDLLPLKVALEICGLPSGNSQTNYQ